MLGFLNDWTRKIRGKRTTRQNVLQTVCGGTYGFFIPKHIRSLIVGMTDSFSFMGIYGGTDTHQHDIQRRQKIERQ